MSSSGFDWLSLPGDRMVEQSHTPPPPRVSFGISPSPSGSQSPTENFLHRDDSHSQTPEIDFKNLFNNVKRGPELTRSDSDQSKVESIKTDDDSKRKIAEEEENILRNFKDDSSVPLALTIEQLTTKEAKTYLRWYNDIITRRGTRTITLIDVFKFLNNFRIVELHKKLIQKIFQSCAHSLNIGQFFCVLRIISHAVVSDRLPSRKLITESSPIPTPVSILARKRQKDTEDDGDEEEIERAPVIPNQDSKLNLDTFAQFMLTGQRPDSPAIGTQRRKKKTMKKVKFSDTVEIDPRSDELPPLPPPPPGSSDKIDFSLPMEQLLGKITSNSGITTPPQQQENEEEELKDMQEQISHFQNVNIDSVSIDGVPANIPSNYFGGSPLGGTSPQREESPQLLQPNLTGSVSKSMRQGLGISSPPPPPPRLRSVSSPAPYEDHLAVPQQYQNLTSSPRVPSPLSFSNTGGGGGGGNSGTTINWQPNQTPAAPPPPPPRFRSSTLPSQSSSPVPPPPRSRKNTNGGSPQIQGQLQSQSTGPALPPKIEVDPSAQPLGFDDYFKNGNVYKSNSDLSLNNSSSSAAGNGIGNGGSNSSDILGDLKALQLEVDRIKYMSGNRGY